MTRTAANGDYLLPFWEALCSLLILLPAPDDSKRHEPDKALSLPNPSAGDMAGMELIFILAARMVLCFRFVTSSVLITHQNSGSFPASHSTTQGVEGRCGGTQVGPKGRVSLSKVAVAQRLAGHQSRMVVNDHLCSTYSPPAFVLLQLLKCLYLDPGGFMAFIPPIFPQPSLGEGLSKWPGQLLDQVNPTYPKPLKSTFSG